MEEESAPNAMAALSLSSNMDSGQSKKKKEKEAEITFVIQRLSVKFYWLSGKNNWSMTYQHARRTVIRMVQSYANGTSVAMVRSSYFARVK